MSAASLLLLLLHLLLIAISTAVQLSDLVGLISKFSEETIHPFSDGTVLISGDSRPFEPDIKLHPIVTVLDPPIRRSIFVLLARVHPANSTVIWATAITTMQEDAAIDIDRDDNIFVAASSTVGAFPVGTVHIIKLKPSGDRLWAVYHTPPILDHGPRYSFESDFDHSRISVLPNAELVLTGERRKTFSLRFPALLFFSATNGSFIRIQDHPVPSRTASGSFEPSSVAVASTRRGPMACYAFEVTKRNSFTGRHSLHATCASLKKGGAVHTRQIEMLDKSKDYFRLGPAVLERNPGSKRQPSVFVAYERVTNTRRRKPPQTNDLFVRRLGSDTLEDVDWTTGEESASAKPIVISLPRQEDRSVSSFLPSLKYSSKARSVALLVALRNTIEKFVPEPKGGGKIVAVEDPDGSPFFSTNWLFFFNKKRQLSTQHLNISFISGIRFSSWDMALTRKEKCVHVLGRPLTIVNASNPLVGRRGKTGGGC